MDFFLYFKYIQYRVYIIIHPVSQNVKGEKMKEQISHALKLIDSSDAIIISASNGLSISEGYNIFADDDNFENYFSHFKSVYGISSLIQGVFARLPVPDHQEFMRKVHQYLIDDYKSTSVFQDLKKLLSSKDYFIVTSNADKHFQLNGFSDKAILEIEGNFDGLTMNSKDWEEQQNRFIDFVQRNKKKKVVQLELGIGSKNKMIKEPLMDMVAKNPSWHYITLNMPQEIYIDTRIEAQSLALPGNINTTFTELLEENK